MPPKDESYLCKLWLKLAEGKVLGLYRRRFDIIFMADIEACAGWGEGG
jgi:hypothetical protein